MYRHVIRFVSFVAGSILSKKQLVATLAMLLCLFATQAQTIYPVQSTSRILPPYSVYLPDYAVNGNDKLQCILVNRDATQTTYQVRLRLTVKLNGRVIMQTSPGYNPAAITLTPNIAQVFAGATLEPYLKSENLDFIGYSQELYEQNRALPEGFYEIGFAAFDYLRQDVQVSNDGWGFYFLAKNEPPLINLPACGTKLPAQYSTPIRFTWLPRNTASLNSVNSTIYRFFLYEVNPKGTNPNDIVNSLPPIYIDSTPLNQTFFDLMPTTNLFRDSFQYVWRVQAADINGADLFRNNGYSEVCTFTWGGPGANPAGSLDPVLNLDAVGETERKGRMWWTKDLVKFDGYKVYYKKSGSGYSWFTSETDKDTLRVLDLEPDTEYECRIQGRKNGSYGIYSDVKYFRTKKIIPVDCSNTADVGPVSNGRPLLNLLRGSTITYRDFNILVTDSIVSKGNGMYAGKGEVSLPFLLGLSFAVTFDNLFIDDAGMVSQGEVQFVSRDLQDWWKEKRDEQEGGNNVGEVITGNDATDLTTSYDIALPTQIQPVQPIINGVTNIIIVKPNPPGGYDTLKNVTLPYTIKDKDGDIYSVEKDGQVKNIGKSGAMAGLNPGTLNKIELSKAKVIFKPHPAQLFAFDVWQPKFQGLTIIESEYQQLNDSATGNPYHVPNKAIEAAKADKIIARIEITDAQTYKADSIRFVTGKGTRYNSKKTSIPGEYEIDLVGGQGGDAQELFALHPKNGGGYTTLGKLKIVSYTPRNEKIVLIPVGIESTQLDANAISGKLNATFGKIAARFNVRIDESIKNDTSWDSNKNKKLDVTGTGILENFSGQSDEIRKIKKLYRSKRPIAKDESYIFLLKNSDVENIAGEMPRGSQYGYVFTEPLNNNKEKISQIIAHEIGHGKYLLKHPFSETINLSKGSTGNLMDYQSNFAVSATDSLYKFQWDQIHDPGRTELFEEDEEGEYAVVNALEELREFANQSSNTLLNGSYTFITPAKQIITLPKDIKEVRFSIGEEYNKCSNGDRTKINPLGSLISFRDKDSVLYTAVTTCDQTNTFRGYSRADPGSSTINDFFVDAYSALLNPTKAILAYPCFANDNLRFTAKQISLQEAFGVMPAIPSSSYYGSGIRFNSLFDKGFNQLSGKEKPIEYGSSAPFFNDYAMDFLREREAYLSECGSKWNEFIFVYANQINYYPGIYKTCILPLVNLKKSIEQYNIQKPYNPYKWGELQPVTNQSSFTYDPVKSIDLLFASQTFAKEEDTKQEMNNRVSSITSAAAMREYFSSHRSPCTFDNLTAANRAHALAQLASGPMYNCQPVITGLNIFDNCAEDFATEIVKRVPASQAVEFIAQLKSKNIIDDLITKIGGNQGHLFISYLAETYYKQANESVRNSLEGNISKVISLLSKTEINQYDINAYQSVYTQINNAKGILYHCAKKTAGSPGDLERYFNDVEVINNSNGVRLKFKTDYRGPIGTFYQTLEVDAFEWVYVLPENLEKFGYESKVGVVMPAFVLHHLIVADNAEETSAILSHLAKVTMVLTFSYELMAFNSLARTEQILTILDIAFTAGDLAVSSFRQELISIFGEEFIRNYDIFSELYLAGRLTPAVFTSGKFVYSKLNDAVNSGTLSNMSQTAKIKLSKIYVKLKGIFGITPDALTRLENVLKTPQFTTVYNNLPKLTDRQISNYATIESFRDRFLDLHASVNASSIKSLEGVIKDFENMVTNYSGVPNIHGYLDEMMQSTEKFKGGAFGMEILSDPPQVLKGKKATGFEGKINNQSKNRYDLEFAMGLGFSGVIAETKNYVTGSLSSISGKITFYNQFQAYFGSIRSMDDFYYIFRSNSNITITTLKDQFKKLFAKNKIDLYAAMQPSLKNELGINGPNWSASFDQLINNTSSDLYKFVILK